MNARSALRSRLRAIRTEYRLSHEEWLSAWSDVIASRVLTLCEEMKARRIMCYYSLDGEVQTAKLLRTLIAAGKEVYLPVTGKDKRMNAVRLRDADAVHAGAFRVMEPDGNERIDPTELELILIPGLAFDARGGRMGYGAGCYDRFLPGCRGTFAALAFEFQMVECVPMDRHDVFMHYVLTERNAYDCRKNRASSERNDMKCSQ